MPAIIDSLLDRITFPKARYYYLHVSLSGLGLHFRDYASLLDGLKCRISSDSTIVVPAFPFGNNKEYGEMLAQESLDFDVDRTPCRVNLFSEMFRRSPHALRTWHPILSVTCLGPDAQALCDTCHLERMPFGPKGIFGMLTSESTCVVGLGVDINTNSFAHMADDFFVQQFPYPLYTSKPLRAVIRKKGTIIHSDDYYTVTVELRRKIKPGLQLPMVEGSSFFQWVPGPAPAYCFTVRPYVSLMIERARQAFHQGRLPRWHQQ